MTLAARPRARGLSINLLLSGFALLGLFLILEIAARIYIAHFADDDSFQLYASYGQFVKRDMVRGMRSKYSPHRYLGHIPTPGYEKGANRHNRLGFRGEEISLDKPPGELRIACLGGSTTYCSSLDDYRQAYPYQLEQILREQGYNVRVINGGAVNYLTLESLINLQLRILDLQPDIIVVYHGVNDILGRLVWPPDAFKSDNSGMKGPLGGPPDVRFYERSALIRFLLVRSGVLRPQSSLDFTLNRLAPTFVGEEFKRQWRAGTYPSGLFKEHPVSDILATNSVAWTRRNLESMAAIARRHGIVPVLMSFASSPDFPAYAWSSSPEFQAAYRESNQMIRDVATQLPAPFFDFAAAFPTSAENFTDGIHVNAQGARLQAQLLARYLVEAGLLTKKKP